MMSALEQLRTRPPSLIAIGGSAGALEVLVDLLGALPRSFPTPVAVVVHLPPGADGGLVSMLRACCALDVVEAEDKLMPEAGHVYVAPPDYHLLVERDRALALSADAHVHFSRPSIDVLFESAACALGPRVLAVLLSGASADGAVGLAAIHARGGITWVQSPESARVPLMPQEALSLAPHDALSVADMTRHLVEWGYAGA
jgi:two-component system chemotaxis response regulator CheB